MSISRHTTYNLLSQALPLAVSVITTPIYLRLIGEARFGVLALIWLFFGYMGLFDLGLGQGISRQLSHLSRKSAKLQAQTLNTALWVGLAIGILGALVAIPLGQWLFVQRLTIEPELRAELMAALPWAVMLIPLATIVSVANGALVARSAFGELGIANACSLVLATLAPLLVAAEHHARLPALLAAVVVARLVVGLGLLWRIWHHYRAMRPALFDRHAAIRLLRFGGWAAVSAAVGPLMVVADRFAIGAVLGSRAVSYYVIPFQLAERITLPSSALNQALFPRLSSAGEIEQRALSIFGLRGLVLWTALPLGAALLLAGPFISWWISPEFSAHASGPARILILAFWINGFAIVPFTKLLAAGRSDLVAKCHIIELAPYCLVLYFSLNHWGITGAAIAFAIRVAGDFIILSFFAGILARAMNTITIPAAFLTAILCTTLYATAWPLALGILLAFAGWLALHLHNGAGPR